MDNTFEVRIWDLRERITKSAKGGRSAKKSYNVRWRVGRKSWSRTYPTKGLAESFRSQLLSALRNGEAFRQSDGLPVSMGREVREEDWFLFAQSYVDLKWTRAAAKSRSGNADALATATLAMLATDRGKPCDKVLRKALTGWAFNKSRRDSAKPAEIQRALKWLEQNTIPVSRLDDLSMVRAVLDQLALKMDGKPAAAKTVSRKRAVLYNALELAVERKLLEKNRVADIKWTAPKKNFAIDRRIVINPEQASTLLLAVEAQQVEGQLRRSMGPRLKAYFAVQYYAALRPEEAAMLVRGDLILPEEGWGELLLSQAAPIAGAAWTDNGARRDRRQLKQRGIGEVRPVPCPPPLTALLHEHLERYGTAADGRLFRSLTGADLAESTVSRVWDRARKSALTETEYKSVLAKRPYDLRHACVSTWLAAGVPSTQVAEWAGHSVDVLHRIYAKILAGQEASARERIERALGQSGGHATSTGRPQTPDDGRTEPDMAG
ncbi:tyrosine-type recombinase/integrase [Amycolatopsis sp.]|uniref:tyrosine-type recombinase/integrase n=1 Tax=Amycolatopsis sp. TaxID=37632 RepID=UPI002B5E3B6D|nr:tyrosine-type recombinase/integrase [Amycolatopsis sp.]HVV10560.1 tyrosine-type recombinase/integrase [Amycolatopsis sp.]